MYILKKLSLILVGGGDRGQSYLKYLDLHPECFELVGIAEPVKEKREHIKNTYNVPSENCFESYEKILAKPKFADIAMICTQDKMHYEPALMAIDKGYDILLEKPVAPTPKECFEIGKAATEKGVKALVCHVLRYTPFYKALKEFLDSGELGEIMNIVHTEGVGNVHMSHSYVRGNWRRSDEASPMILAKCCHDVDLLQWLCGKGCESVQSYGTTSFFTKENAPEGAPDRCLDGCPKKDECPYFAPSLYCLDTAEVKHFRAVVANKPETSDEELFEILKTSPYGRCAFKCDNDVVDHQVVNMRLGKDICANLTMSAFNKGGRESRFMGTKGELYADMENQSLKFYSFDTRETKEIYTPLSSFDQSIAGGHGGGDMGIMQDLYDYVALDKKSYSISDISDSCLSHIVCFAAEQSRTQNKVIDIDTYIKSL